MAKTECKKEPTKCKCGGEPCVIVREYSAQVYCTECGRVTTRMTRENAVKAWNGWMTRTKEAKRRQKYA